MIYFWDTCAIARYYCNDLGTYILKDIVTDDNSIIISYLSIPETISALKRCVNDNTLNYTQEDYERDKQMFLRELEKKFVTVSPNKSILDRAVGIADKLGTAGADSVILATCLTTMELIRRDNEDEECTFVTSDKLLYRAACQVSGEYSYFKALHFWSCKCPHCGEKFIAQKHKKNLCPACKKVVCEDCNSEYCLEPSNEGFVNICECAIEQKVVK